MRTDPKEVEKLSEPPLKYEQGMKKKQNFLLNLIF